ncbi:hypothetical protein BCR32DRAFT_265424 [Anaeromyces robustus]|uniref:Carbohydrate-binding domain-containing protein n=1 Tax=Anaeromyces robustus TaxID=1754192 RepID=A0A1Y1XK02_9FUNG|nr:hypothetical protein BCR32DRAFT_265424 [Anaeromyces robustus]|eukprot:ORX85786.1 hypothetical protein BCR32DRAFT_265424 [Anaeromyces robustus]
MKFQKQILYIFVILFLLNLVHADTKDDTNQEPEVEQVTEKVTEQVVEQVTESVTEPEVELVREKQYPKLIPGPITGNYNKKDLNEIYDESSIEIECSGTICNSTSSDNVLLDEGKVTISESGTYILEGELNGQVNIIASTEDNVHLILKNATISSEFGPAIYAENYHKLVITLEGQNNLSDTSNYPEGAVNFENEDEDEDFEEIETKTNSLRPNACIFSAGDLTFNGKGSLDINGNFNIGIRSKSNLKLVSGKMNIVSKGSSIRAMRSISIKDAEINIDTGKSGIVVTKDNNPYEGYVVIDGGKITVKAVKDGIHAETHLTVNDGMIKILESEEGLEGQMIDITGGDITIDSSDDGINGSRVQLLKDAVAEGKVSKEEIDEQVYIRFTGGRVDVRAEGPDLDAIDSNGSLYIGDNAEVYSSVVYGGAFGHMSALDSDGYKSIEANATALITGSGNMPSSSTDATPSPDGIKGTVIKNYWYDEPNSCTVLQPYVKVNIQIQLEGTSVIVKDSKGKVLLDHKPRAQFGVIFFTSPEIIEGEKYTITAGEITKEVKAKVDKKKNNKNGKN